MTNTITLRRYACGCRYEYDAAGYLNNRQRRCRHDSPNCRMYSSNPDDYAETTRIYEMKP